MFIGRRGSIGDGVLVSGDEARRRVLRVIAAARRIQDSSDALGQEARAVLPEATGLTSETVELALREHFETSPTDAEIDALLASTGNAAVCHVVLSANVCTAPLRAIALAVATSPRVYVKPSRRDPVVTELLVRLLVDDPEFVAEGHLEIVETVCPESGHELHIYGSDATIVALTSNLPEGVVVRAHGTGIGLAVVGGATNLDVAAEAIARDVIVFDQRGCLSPRFVLIEGDVLRGERFVEAIYVTLDKLSLRYPRGKLDEAFFAEIAQYRATMQAIGSYSSGASFAVGFDPEPRALVLPPAARIVHVVAAQAHEVRALLEPWARYVTAVGVDDAGALSTAVLSLVPEARRSELGAMQTPLFDGPVDKRATSSGTAGSPRPS